MTRTIQALVFLLGLALGTSALGQSYLLIKVRQPSGERYPNWLALQARKEGEELTHEILKHRGMHKRLTSDLTLVPLKPGTYQLIHLCYTQRAKDPGTRYLDFIPIEIRPDSVHYFGDFNLLEGEVSATFQSRTVEEACEREGELMAERPLLVQHAQPDMLVFTNVCGSPQPSELGLRIKKIQHNLPLYPSQYLTSTVPLIRR